MNWEREKCVFICGNTQRMFRFPQAGILVRWLFKQHIKHGYYKVQFMPGSQKHISPPIQFMLIVDDFGIKYVGEDHATHHLTALQQNYTINVDWSRKLYWSITLQWYYKRYFNAGIQKPIIKIQASLSIETTRQPFSCSSQKCGTIAWQPIHLMLNKVGHIKIQQIVGSILYYAYAVDLTLPTAPSSTAKKQPTPQHF